MTEVWRYSHGDIANWARFSGDYNPIHFDVDASKRFGHESVIVHGMLGVLQALERVQAELVVAKPAAAWLSVKQRLRVPIYPDEELEMVVSAPSRARLIQRANRAVKVSVDVQATDDFDDPARELGADANVATLRLSPVFVAADPLRDSLASLRSNFPWLSSDVTLLQAAAFAYFMKLRIGTLEDWVVRSVLPRGGGYTVVQTSHRALVPSSWLGVGGLGNLDAGMRMSFAPVVMTLLSTGCACACRIEVDVKDRPAFFTEVGLLLSHHTKEYQ